MKNRSNKVILKFTPIDPNKRKPNSNSKTEDIETNAVRNPETNLWHIRHPAPVSTPPNLQIQFTNFNRLMDHITEYYSKRNLKIGEIIDAF